jgi:hypothetical protein
MLNFTYSSFLCGSESWAKKTAAVQNRCCWGEIRKTDRSMCRPQHARAHTWEDYRAMKVILGELVAACTRTLKYWNNAFIMLTGYTEIYDSNEWLNADGLEKNEWNETGTDHESICNSHDTFMMVAMFLACLELFVAEPSRWSQFLYRSGLQVSSSVLFILKPFLNFSFHPLCCLISVTISIQSNTTNYHVRLSNSELTIRSMRQHVSVVCRSSSGLQEWPYVNCNAIV